MEQGEKSSNLRAYSQAPHSYASPPFARANLSSAASTSLLHRRGLRAGTSQNLGPINISAANSQKIPKPILSPSATSEPVFDHKHHGSMNSNATHYQASGSPPDSLLNALKGQGGNIQSKNVWDGKSSSPNEESSLLPSGQIKDEKQAKKNDRILQERLMEAKSMNTKATSGATVHKFSLWSGVKNQSPPVLAPVELSPISLPSSQSNTRMFSPTHGHDELTMISSPTSPPMDAPTYKSGKVRGHKAAINSQGNYEIPMTMQSTNLPSLDVNSNSQHSNRESKLRQSAPAELSYEEKSERNGKSGLSSSLRNKIDKAANVSLPLAEVNRERNSTGKSKNLFPNESRPKSTSLVSDSMESDIAHYKEDAEDTVVHGSLNEEEYKVHSRPASEPTLDEKTPPAGRPPLPGIRHQLSMDSQTSGNGSHHSKSRSKRSDINSSSSAAVVSGMDEKYKSSRNPNVLLPVMGNDNAVTSMANFPPRNGLVSLSPVLLHSAYDPDMDISPLHSNGTQSENLFSPPNGKNRNRHNSDDKRSKYDNNTKKFSSAPVSPTTSPKVSPKLSPKEIIPKLAFRSRNSSINMSTNTNSSTNSDDTMHAQNLFKDESETFAFCPIKDTPPESRSHSIYIPNAQEITSNLSITLHSFDHDTSTMDDSQNKSSSTINDSSISHKTPESRKVMELSPDYSRDTFDSPSPTLSVMSHISEHDVSDRYEQLVYTNSPNTQSPAGMAAAHNYSSKTNTLNNSERKVVEETMKALDGIDITPRDLFRDPPDTNKFNTVLFNEDDDKHGYSEVIYIGPDGENTLRWKKGQPIGEGTFGRVYKGMNESTGKLAAVKQLGIANGSDHDIETIKREIKVMWQLDHENIVRYLGASQSNRYLFIVLEYVSGGSIAGMLQQFGPFSESLIRKFSCHVICGVEYLHNKGIVHRDIKGANVLVTDTGIAKIADFGCSKQLAGLCTTSLEESLRTIRGSVPWMAPEVIKQAGHGRSSDIWSVGATVIEMATGFPPWSEFTNNLAALFHVATSKEPPPFPNHLSRVCTLFLTKCMMVEASKRATAFELLSQDEFLRSELEQQKKTRMSIG